MRNPKLLSLSILCAAVLAGCGGDGDTNAAQAGADTLASADLKSRRSRSDGGSSDSGSASTSTSAASATLATTATPVGRLLASNCFNCHGTDGHPNGGFDQLAGESASEIVKELKEMAAKTDEGGIMRIHAMGYTDEQLRQLGTYFASQR